MATGCDLARGSLLPRSALAELEKAFEQFEGLSSPGHTPGLTGKIPRRIEMLRCSTGVFGDLARNDEVRQTGDRSPE